MEQTRATGFAAAMPGKRSTCPERFSSRNQALNALLFPKSLDITAKRGRQHQFLRVRAAFRVAETVPIDDAEHSVIMVNGVASYRNPAFMGRKRAILWTLPH